MKVHHHRHHGHHGHAAHHGHHRPGNPYASPGRPQAKLTHDVRVLGSDGRVQIRHKGEHFVFGGVDKKGNSVIYNQHPGHSNPEGTTFFGTLLGKFKKFLRIQTKDKHGHKHWSKVGPHSRHRGAAAPHGRHHKTHARHIQAHGLPQQFVHDSDSPLWEYTNLPHGLVSGSETPAGFRHGKKDHYGRKYGTGYSAGIFHSGQIFHELKGKQAHTAVYFNEPGVAAAHRRKGMATWKLGWVHDHGAKVWTWMIDHVDFEGKRYPGNLR